MLPRETARAVLADSGMHRIDASTLSAALLVGILVGCGSSVDDTVGTTAGADASGGDSAIDVTADGGGSQGDGRDMMTDASAPREDGGGSGGDGADDATTDSGGPSKDGTTPAADAPIDGQQDSSRSGDAGRAPCAIGSDCRTFSNYCGGCTCDALGSSQPDTTCDAGTVTCLVDPCLGHTAVCDQTGHCALQ